MFTIAKEKTHFSESHGYRLFTPEINRPTLQVQIVLASVPLGGQHPVGKYPLANIPHPKPAAGNRQQILPCPLPAFHSPKSSCGSNRDAHTWDLCWNNRMPPSTSPPRLCHGIFLQGRREQCVDVYWIKGPATIPPRRCRAQHRVSSLLPGGLKQGYPFCPRLRSAVWTPPGRKGL